MKGRGSQILCREIAVAVEEGNAYDRLNARDRYGSAVTPVKPRKSGLTGPPLAPRRAASRVVANFKAVARKRGGAWQIVAGWQGGVSSEGAPFLPFHDVGGGRLPGRPILGVSPRTWAAIRTLLARFRDGVRRAR